VTVITPEAGCSTTSTATVSTTGATGGLTFRATFFAGAGLGLALAAVRFAAFATLRALPRLAELRSFARFCTFDAFLRLAMIRPALVGGPQRMMSDQNGPATDQTSYPPDFSLSANTLALFFVGRTGSSPPPAEGKMGTKVKIHHFTARSTPNDCRPRKRHVWGTKAKPLSVGALAALLSRVVL
jgi:hypothetical protein